MIGAPQADDRTGTAYLFKNVAGVWTEEDKLKGSESDTFDSFGRRVAIDGDVAFVGAISDVVRTLVFCVDGSDTDGDGTLDEYCLSAAPVQPETSVATNRYITFAADQALSFQAVRVAFLDLPVPFDVLNGQDMWVGRPRVVSEYFGRTDSTEPTTTVAALQCDPCYEDWSARGAIF